MIQRCLQGLDLRVGSQLQMPNRSLKTIAHLLALKVFIIIAWAASCGRMVLQSSVAIVRISLLGILAGFQVLFAQSSFSWVQIEPFANALLD